MLCVDKLGSNRDTSNSWQEGKVFHLKSLLGSFCLPFRHQGYLGLPRRHSIGSLAFACWNSSRWTSVRIGTVYCVHAIDRLCGVSPSGEPENGHAPGRR